MFAQFQIFAAWQVKKVNNLGKVIDIISAKEN